MNRGEHIDARAALTHGLPFCILRPFTDDSTNEDDRLDRGRLERLEDAGAVVGLSVGHELGSAVRIFDGKE